MFPPGTAPVKAEYLISLHIPTADGPDDDAAEGATKVVGSSTVPSSGPSSLGRKKLSKQEKKAQRGQNKGRRFQKVHDEVQLCWRTARGNVCDLGSGCRFTHDIPAYLSSKEEDIVLPSTSDAVINGTPFTAPPVSEKYSSMKKGIQCPIYLESGECRYGYKCRFLGAHVDFNEEQDVPVLRVDEERKSRSGTASEFNFIGSEASRLLQKKKYPTPIADKYLKELEGTNNPKPSSNSFEDKAVGVVVSEPEQSVDIVTDTKPDADPEAQADTPDVPIRFREKKSLDWRGKTYLAPLTTVGNLPFRRLCVSYGADITCGEMALATSLLQGSKEEWSLVRRHESERVFGVQVAGNKPATVSRTVEIIGKECGGTVDFVDLNCGCPIDLVYKSGSGSALLDNYGKLSKIIVGMNKALGDIPVTVKIRNGVKDNRPNAHKIMPKLDANCGASCITLHGRSRQQRYTKLADWQYIKQCVEAVRKREAEDDLPTIPIFGGGDCFSSQDYWEHVEESGVDGVMIGRGALIKPWIFTEINERREWDISARERLDGIRKYAEYGLSHFGSDTAGVNTTRRYLCEALSFQYRYIPIGLLEQLPGRINDRAPSFKGRDELETLLASGNSENWVKLSEMFLGPAPASWSFTPKHKSNAYESQG